MRENLEGIRQVLVEVPSQKIIQSKIDELDSFFEYHQLVLECTGPIV